MRFRCRALASCFAIAAALTVTHSSVHAQTASGDEAARVLYEAGARAYAAGDFDAATQALSKAYSLAPRATVLFSLAQAERRLFTLNADTAALESAEAHFKAYLEQVPQGGRRADAVAALGELAVLRARRGEALAPTQPAPTRAATRMLISAEPDSATIRVDGVEMRERPLILETSPGPHLVSVSAPGYVAEERQVSAVTNGVVATEFRLIARPGTLRLAAPSGTTITLDGRVIGEAPVVPLTISAGQHRLRFSSPGHYPEVRVIEIARGGDLHLSVALRSTPQRSISQGFLVTGGAATLGGGIATSVAFVFEGRARDIERAAKSGNISRAELLDHNRQIERRDTWRTVAVISLTAAAALFASGATLHLWNPDAEGAEPRKPGKTARALEVGSDGLRLRL